MIFSFLKVSLFLEIQLFNLVLLSHFLKWEWKLLLIFMVLLTGHSWEGHGGLGSREAGLPHHACRGPSVFSA